MKEMAPRLLCFSSIVLIIMMTMMISTSSAVKTYVEIPESGQFNGTTYIVSSFSPKTFIRSADFDLNSTQCVQYSFKLKERRVR
uniref:Transmembrane protein n=1 Tax=Caenorhabditis japonica TaxID=281687 RepID=A0A2Q4TJQ4_CAEJA